MSVLGCWSLPAEARCNSTVPYHINVNYEDPHVRIIPTSHFDIHAGGIASLGGSWMINGLTDATLLGSIDVEGVSDRECFYPTQIAINFSYRVPVKVFILDKYEEGSCNYDVVYNHEMTHVQLYRSTPRKFEVYVRDALQASVNSYYEDFLSKGDGSNDTFLSIMNTSLNSIINRMGRYNQIVNAKLDTLEAYRKQMTLCPSW